MTPTDAARTIQEQCYGTCYEACNQLEAAQARIAALEGALADLKEYVKWSTLYAQLCPHKVEESNERLRKIFHAGYVLYQRYDVEGRRTPEGGGK